MPINKIEAALDDIRQGKMVILVDDEDRENEGDLIIAAEIGDKGIFPKALESIKSQG